MRRKSRILLCFAVLWVLGIAYYFYSGTTLSRKVGFPFIDCCRSARRPSDRATLRGQSWCDSAPLPSSWGALPFAVARFGEDFDERPASITVGRIWFGGGWEGGKGVNGDRWSGRSACSDLPVLCRRSPRRPGENGERGDAGGVSWVPEDVWTLGSVEEALGNEAAGLALEAGGWGV